MIKHCLGNSEINSIPEWRVFLLNKRKSLRAQQARADMYGLLTKCEVKMTGYWPSSFFWGVYGPWRSRGPWYRKKRTRPIPNHLDRANLVNKGFIIWLSVKFFLRDTAGSPDLARRHNVLLIHDIMRKPNSIIVLLYIFHIIHLQKQKRSVQPFCFWEHSRRLSNQADVELDIINAISAADIAFIMSSSQAFANWLNALDQSDFS